MGIGVYTMPELGGELIDLELDETLRSEWVRVPFAAEYLGVHDSTLYKQIKKGQIRSRRIASLVLVSREDILNWSPRRPGPPPKR
ncbi:helix-turn-helix domain-containing protein [Aggregatilinea sp.]|uniref:helix-turn-helix domain-containing protein n=1 Tax=Aggregatilinea sp. TaxID=2806333 RepID=UPI003FA5289E